MMELRSHGRTHERTRRILQPAQSGSPREMKYLEVVIFSNQKL